MASWYRLGSPTSQEGQSMRNDNLINQERLEGIAKGLNGRWVYHQILSEDRDNFGHYLFCSSLNLYIRCRTAYKEKIEQWSLCYRHPNGLRHIQTFETIGCSLTKSDSAVCKDLNGRLIDNNLESILTKISDLKKEHEANIYHRDTTNLEIEALERVYDVARFNHGRHDQNLTISKKGCEGNLARISKWHGKPHYSLEVGYLSIDKLFKVLSVLSE